MEAGPAVEPMEDGEAKQSCVRAFFLLSWRAGPWAGEEMQVFALEDVLLRLPDVPEVLLNRLS